MNEPQEQKSEVKNNALEFELDTIRETARFLKEENAALREQLAKVKAFWGLAGSISDELAMAHKCTGMMCYTCAKINTLRSLEEQHGK